MRLSVRQFVGWKLDLAQIRNIIRSGVKLFENWQTNVEIQE